ncbi:translation initiation factor eIF2B subunit epsilon [Lampetra fluviatilis]
MAGKSGKQGGGRPGREELRQEDVLQAVLLADSFDQRFGPVTRDAPRALLPLVNVPMIDYALEMLAAAGVQQTFIFCCWKAEEVRAYISKSRWSAPGSRNVVRVLSSETFRSLGDVLRDVDAKTLVRSDFLLVHADLVCNASLKSALQQHKQRRERERNVSVMTMVFRECRPGHRARTRHDDVVVAADACTGRVLHYQHAAPGKIRLPLHIFQGGSGEVEVRHDLLDCHISICSPQVAELFTDNFDYQTRDDFVRGILVNEEILGNQIHMVCLRDSYAARASSLYAYHAVSCDIVRRWPCPFTPEVMVPSAGCGDGYALARHNVYRAPGVSLGPGSLVEGDSVMGQDTTIGAGCHITRTVIGRRCSIGSNVRLEDAVLWDDVTIADGVVVCGSLVCSGASIRQNVRVLPRCVISYGTVVGPDVSLPEGTAVSLHVPRDADDDDDYDEFSEEESSDQVKAPSKDKGYNPAEVGSEGKGYVWNLISRGEAKEDDADPLADDVWGLSLEEVPEEESEEESEDESGGDVCDGKMSPPPDDTKMFYNEVLDSLQRGAEENVSCDNLVLEINSSKYAYNVSLRDVMQALTRGAVDVVLGRMNKMVQASEFMKALKPLLVQWTPLFRNYVKRLSDHMDVLAVLEEAAFALPQVHAALATILMTMYEEEVLEEEAIMRWFTQTGCSEKARQLRQLPSIQKFVQWLREADEESSDEN